VLESRLIGFLNLTSLPQLYLRVTNSGLPPDVSRDNVFYPEEGESTSSRRDDVVVSSLIAFSVKEQTV
jgi:hypothetical protein